MTMCNYSSKTLMGNWLEDRLAPSKVLTQIHTRDLDKEFKVNRIKRFLNPSTKGTIADFCQNDFVTTNKSSLIRYKPKSALKHEEVKMIRLKTFSPEQSTRNCSGPQFGFGAVLPRHPPSQFERLQESVSRAAHRGALADGRTFEPEPINPNLAAGISNEYLEAKEAKHLSKIQVSEAAAATSLPGLGAQRGGRRR